MLDVGTVYTLRRGYDALNHAPTELEENVTAVRAIDAAAELIHAAGGTVETRNMSVFEDRDWETESQLDPWVGKYVRNIALNYHEILRERHIGPLKDALAKGHPDYGTDAHEETGILPRHGAVAIVGAGPSLDKNVEHLRNFPGLLIACDRAAIALTARGIHPDLVVCVDPRAAVMAEYLNYPENRDQTLVLSVICDPDVARAWRGKKFYMSTIHPGTQLFDRVLPDLFPGMPGMMAAGNVGNTAVQLAEWIGAEKIVLVGQDYGYAGDKMACDQWVRFPNSQWARFEETAAERAAKLEQRTGKVVVDGIETYGQFVGYRKTLMEMVKSWELNIVNATEGGLLQALPCAALSDVVRQLRDEKYKADEAHALLDKATGGTP